MSRIFLDESVSGTFVGYGSLIMAEDSSGLVVQNALDSLSRDPDRLIESCRKLDDGTIKRGYFHASMDSMNSHSHLCHSISSCIRGEFFAQIMDANKQREEQRTLQYLFDLTSGLSSLEVFKMRDPIEIVFEERNGLSKVVVENWLQQRRKDILMTIYDQPYFPALFPEVRISVSDKGNQGLQCCDFLLWSVMRKLSGNNDWYDRIKSSARVAFHQKDKSWFGFNLVFGKKNIYNPVNYEVADFPSNPDSKVNDKKLIEFYIYAEQVILSLAKKGVPAHLKYLENKITSLADTCCVIEQRDRVSEVASMYLQIFDTLPLIKDDTTIKFREFLLLSKKYLALILHKGLINGCRTRDYLHNMRIDIINNNPECLAIFHNP